MRNKTIQILKYSFLIIGLVFIVYLFYPRTYDVLAHEKMAATKHWSLPSGSNIGYIHLNAKEPKNPFPIIYLHGGPGGVITESTIQMLTPFAKAGYDIYT